MFIITVLPLLFVQYKCPKVHLVSNRCIGLLTIQLMLFIIVYLNLHVASSTLVLVAVMAGVLLIVIGLLPYGGMSPYFILSSE